MASRPWVFRYREANCRSPSLVKQKKQKIQADQSDSQVPNFLPIKIPSPKSILPKDLFNSIFYIINNRNQLKDTKSSLIDTNLLLLLDFTFFPWVGTGTENFGRGDLLARFFLRLLTGF